MTGLHAPDLRVLRDRVAHEIIVAVVADAGRDELRPLAELFAAIDERLDLDTAPSLQRRQQLAGEAGPYGNSSGDSFPR